MRVPRVFLTTGRPEGTLDLSAQESYHLVRVLRRSTGSRVLLVHAQGGAFDAEIVAVGEGKEGPIVSVRVLGESSPLTPVGLPWTLAVAVVKGEGFELGLRMAAELGLERFLPVLTARTVVKPVAGSGRVERWARIAREAAKQCGRSVPMELLAPLHLKDLLAGWRDLMRGREARSDPGTGEKAWILLPSAPFRPEILGLRGLLEGAAGPEGGTEGPSGPESALFLVGPEGGFTSEEAAAAQAAGLEPLGFPTPILRTPTAAALVAALGVLTAALGASIPSRERPPSAGGGK